MSEKNVKKFTRVQETELPTKIRTLQLPISRSNAFQFHVTTEKSSTTFAAEMNQIHLHLSAPYKGDVFASLARNSV